MVVSLTTLLYGLFVGSAVCSAAAVEAPPGITARDARIVGDGVTLAGTLYLPSKTKRPMPGVVIVHGSGPTTRAMTTFWTNRVKYFEGTPIPTSILLVGVLALAAWSGAVRENLRLREINLFGFRLHPWY